MTNKTNSNVGTNARPADPKTQDEFERDIAKLHTLADKGKEPITGDMVQGALNSIATQGADAGYEDLKLILELAFDQAAAGKGRDRHATGPTGFRPWTQQPILEIGRMVGPGYAAGQVAKKVQEAVTMAGNNKFEAAQAEALGAIVYAAALYKLIFEMNLNTNEG